MGIKRSGVVSTNGAGDFPPQHLAWRMEADGPPSGGPPEIRRFEWELWRAELNPNFFKGVHDSAKTKIKMLWNENGSSPDLGSRHLGRIETCPAASHMKPTPAAGALGWPFPPWMR